MFRRDIEGLRALAVGFVVLFHAHFLGFTGGFIGVDVFFVVSGFLISTLLINEHSSSGKISLGNFYARRARRLLPASAIVIAATAVASRLWLEPLRLRDVGTEAIASGGFFSNILFANRSTDYLRSGQPPSPFQHFWSLSVEEQFYILWPALLLLLLWRAGAHHLRAMTGVAIISIVSFGLCVWQTPNSQPWAFFALHTRAWELGVGALVALAWRYIDALPATFRAVIGWSGLGAITLSALVLDETMAFPGTLTLLPVAGTALILMAGSRTSWGPQIFLSWRPLQWIGGRSYSIYLWHWPVLVIAEVRAGSTLNVTQRSVCIVIAVALAALSFRFVENPVRQAKTLHIKTRLTLALGAGLIIISLTVGFVLRSSSVALSSNIIAQTPIAVPTTSTTTIPIDQTTTQPPVTTIPSGPPPSILSAGTPLQALVDAIDTGEVPANLQPSLRSAAGDMAEIYDNGCHVGLSNSTIPICIYGDTTSKFTVALYGDSHAAQWFPALDQVAIAHNWRLVILTKMGCTPIELITYNSLVGPTYPGCRPWREEVMKRFVTENVSVVFIAYSNRLQDPATHQPFANSLITSGFATLIPSLQAMGVSPIIITDTPYPGTDVPICLSRAIHNVRSCSFTREKGLNSSRQQTNIDIAVDNGAQSLDISNWVCGLDICPVIAGNLLMYRDSNHLTTTYMNWLTPLFEAAVGPYVDGVRSRSSAS